MAKCGIKDCDFKGSEAEYLAHVCKGTGFNPTEIEHQDALTDGRFSHASEAALARGAARKGEKEHPSVAVAKEAGEKVNADDPD